MKLSIVILNWNGAHHLSHFLPSVVNYSSYDWAEVIVADNHSEDQSSKVIKEEFPTVGYIQLDKNYGFAEGYNLALQDLNSDYFLLLNSDVEVTEGWLEPLIELMDNDPAIAACQPKILQLDHPEKFEYAGAAGGFIDHYGYPFCRGRIMDTQEEDLGQYNQPVSVFWASGAAMVIRGKLWQTFGGFDADFWAHMEEIDLCWRMKNAGFKIAVCPQSKVGHLGGGSLAYGNPRKVYLNFRNNLFILYKNLPHNKLHKVLLLRMMLDGMAAIQFLITGKIAAFAKVFSAHIDFYKNLPKLRAKRRALQIKLTNNDHPEIYKGSIVFDFFLRKKKKFSSLDFKTIPIINK